MQNDNIGSEDLQIHTRYQYCHQTQNFLRFSKSETFGKSGRCCFNGDRETSGIDKEGES